MRAIVSGESALAVILDGPHRQCITVGRVAPSLPAAGNPYPLFNGAGDLRFEHHATVDGVHASLLRAWSFDRALKLMLLFLDPNEPAEDLLEYSECIEELCQDDEVFQALSRRMLSSAVPGGVNSYLLTLCSGHDRVGGLLTDLAAHQASVKIVRDAFERISDEHFESSARIEVLVRLIETGWFSRVVRAHALDSGLDFLKLKLINENQDLKRVVAQWFAYFGSSNPRFSRPIDLGSSEWEEEDTYDDASSESTRTSSAAAFEQVRAQQRGIVDKLKDRDIDGAHRFMDELIQSQSRHSSSEQIAKSYCAMAQEAKVHEIPELQYEWAERATRVNPYDPMTFGHLADALIGLGRFGEAEQALKKIATDGDILFAGTRRAKILVSTGRAADGLALYEALAQEHEGRQGIVHAELGAAEALRELGRSEDALTRYEVLTQKYPLDAFAWAGLASVQMELGQLQNAIVNFGKAATNRNDAVGYAGRATAQKLAGNFSGALKTYEELLKQFPNNQVGLCGQAEVLRLSGDKLAALKAYDVARTRSPHSPVPFSGKAGLLAEMRRYDEAIALLEEGKTRFPYNYVLQLELINALKASGRFSEALSATDQLLGRRPFDLDLRLKRASLLYRLRCESDALVEYNLVLEADAGSIRALYGKACVLIQTKEYAAAHRLLENLPYPKTQDQWRLFALKALAIAQTENLKAALRHLTKAFVKCPFAEQRKNMRSISALLELANGRFTEASKTADAAHGELDNVVALHVFAATRQISRANMCLERITASDEPGDVVYLAREIAKRHSIIDGEPNHEESWILAEEQRLLLAA